MVSTEKISERMWGTAEIKNEAVARTEGAFEDGRRRWVLEIRLRELDVTLVIARIPILGRHCIVEEVAGARAVTK